ncbi:MAG: Gldg family protein, partial [Kiritimatiellae bacterium]|nr:Gldg family protein [Kiritimatiellia bacterium]
MSPVRVTWARTVAQLAKSRSTAFALAVFMAAAAALLAFNLEAAEGSALSLGAVWALSISPILPVLAVLASMDVWSEERRTGRIDLLLASAVRERDFVIGKFFGAWTFLMSAVALSLVSSGAVLWIFAPSVFSGVALMGFIPALFILALQGALWCAVSTMVSSLFRRVASSLCVSLTLLVALPRGIWAGLLAWSHEGRRLLGEMPLDAHALDFASGAFSTGIILMYLLAVALALFINSKAVSSLRLTGRGAAGIRASGAAAVALALVFAALAGNLVMRADIKFNIPFGQIRSDFSERTKRILSECDGEITVTAYLPRSDRRFRPVGHFLRALKRESDSHGGARVVLRFVDPSWDIAAAQRLVRRGVKENSVVFERGRRLTTVPVKDGFGERICASAIQRVAAPPVGRNIYWTVGHGESAGDDYGTFGMSDIARDLAREGYVNRRLDFSAGSGVPRDCAVLVVPGAKDDFSRMETGMVESYLRQGGRLLVLAPDAERGGVVSLLPGWGLRPAKVTLSGTRTLSGDDVIVSDFSEHELSAPLKGSRIVLGRPVAFTPSAVADAGSGAGKIDFVPLASVCDAVVAAAVERGGGAGDDIAVRPTRIIAVGDASFVMNGMLSARANANRDFFLNCVAYLSGSGKFDSGGSEAGVLTTGMDRGVRGRYLLSGAIAVPVAVFALMLL